MIEPGRTVGRDRALFERVPRLVDLVPFTPLADGLPTPVERVTAHPGRLWVQRDDLTSSLYGGNKVRKLEFTLPVAARRGGGVVTAGGAGSHHVLATAVHGARLGVDVSAVRFPQPLTDDVAAVSSRSDALGVNHVEVPWSYLMPLGLAWLLARGFGRAGLSRAARPPTLLWPGASTPMGALGHVSAGLELVAAFAAAGEVEPEDVVCALGSGGTAVGLAIGVALGGWRQARVVGVRVADRVVTNHLYLAPLVTGTLGLLALGGAAPVRPKLTIDGRWLGRGYGHPTPAGAVATTHAAALGLTVEPTYTAKAFAAARALVDAGRRVVFVQTYAAPG